SCILRRLKKTPQARHMTINPIFMSDEQVNNVLVKVSAEVARRNMDTNSMIRELYEDLKTKDEEIVHITQERDFTQKKNKVFIRIAEEIRDN
ncbi:hypothetical protein KI387_013815, partial [Taxus chinensis]